jgi:hypothetical protein
VPQENKCKGVEGDGAPSWSMRKEERAIGEGHAAASERSRSSQEDDDVGESGQIIQRV